MATVILKSQKQIVGILKGLDGVKSACRLYAEDVGADAARRLAAHRNTGAAHIEVTSGKVDSYVALVDEAAMSIEFGHIHNFTGREVRGLYIITGAAGLL